MNEQGDRRFWSVIPAGGSGTRLWPLSRAGRPKYLLPIAGERSLLQQTWDRLLPLSSPDRILVVAGAAHAAAIARQLPDLPEENILIEPQPRGTGPAIGLAAGIIASRDSAAIMGSFAADHVVTDTEAFTGAVETAIAAASQGWLVTIGVQPSRPETGYGYIERTNEVLELDAALPGVAYRAAGFREKPSYEAAVEFIRSGRYDWNASMFIWSVETFATEMRRYLPVHANRIARIVSVWNEPDRDETLAREWNAMKPVTIDEGLMERTDRLAVVPAEMGWSDVGDWHGLGALISDREDGNAFRGNVLAHATRDTLVWSTSGRLVALVGVGDLAVIDTPDALLVVNRHRAQEVRSIVDKLAGGMNDLI
jgi:mannose-1-phosphate guanylyltransferase